MSHPTSTPNRIAVVGGHGQIAQQLHPMIVAAGHTPVALVRKEDQRAELEALGAEVRILDLEAADVSGYRAAFEGCSAVVFAAGGGGDGSVERKKTVDLDGSTKSVEAATVEGISRFVQISAIGADDELPDDTGEVWRAYIEAKRDADAVLRDSDLDWTIIRPGKLTNDTPNGLVDLGTDVARSEIPRADVAAVVTAALTDDRSIGQQWNLVSGDTPVPEAISSAV